MASPDTGTSSTAKCVDFSRLMDFLGGQTESYFFFVISQLHILKVNKLQKFGHRCCNFKTHYRDNIICHLCKTHEDTQEHCLECDIIRTHNHEIKQHIEYDHIFGDEEQQVQAAQYLHHLLNIRADLMEEDPALGAGP